MRDVKGCAGLRMASDAASASSALTAAMAVEARRAAAAAATRAKATSMLRSDMAKGLHDGDAGGAVRRQHAGQGGQQQQAENRADDQPGRIEHVHDERYGVDRV